MFLKYLEPIFKPYRMVRNYIISVRTTKGNFQAEVARVKRFGNVSKSKLNEVKGKVQQVQGQAKQAQGQVGQVQGQVKQVQGQAQQMQGRVQQMQGQAMWPQGQPMAQGQPGQARGPMPPGQMPRAQMQPGPMSPGQMPANMPVGALNPNPPVKTVGFFRRRKVCTQCNTELDKTWDSCPYCAQAAAGQQQPAAGPSKPLKTQAFMVDGGSTRQLLGWLVPIDGPQRGELYTLAPLSVIGTDPTCHVVLSDQFMSTKHAEIKAENGLWMLRDLGSTNGTYVNDQRISQRELVDNDFIRFGQSIVKFKSL
jgi:TolA-binding protein